MKLKDILKAAGNKYATVASDGLEGSLLSLDGAEEQKNEEERFHGVDVIHSLR